MQAYENKHPVSSLRDGRESLKHSILKAVCFAYCLIPKKLFLSSERLENFVSNFYDRFNAKLDDSIRVLNYGYSDLDSEVDEERLQREPDSLRLNLYKNAIKHLDLSDKRVLEVGSGRGGGASYIARTGGAREYVGLDLCPSSVDDCNRNYADVDNLSFCIGNAEDLPFEDNRFDVLINIESSHNYKNCPRFFAEASRVLKPDGIFVYADFRRRWLFLDVYKQLSAAGFRIREEELINLNIVKSLKEELGQKTLLMRKNKGNILSRWVTNAMAGNSFTITKFEQGYNLYYSFVLVNKTGRAEKQDRCA